MYNIKLRENVTQIGFVMHFPSEFTFLKKIFDLKLEYFQEEHKH